MKKNNWLIVFQVSIVIICLMNLSLFAQETVVLTKDRLSVVIESGKDVVIYGTNEPCNITIKKGAVVKILNNMANNTIIIDADFSEFIVYRSGAMVIFESNTIEPFNLTKTVIKLPATKILQTIKFNKIEFKLSIESGKVMFGGHEITLVSKIEKITKIKAVGKEELFLDWEKIHDLNAKTTNGNSANTLDSPLHMWKGNNGQIYCMMSNVVNYRLSINSDFTISDNHLTYKEIAFDSGETTTNYSEYYHKGYYDVDNLITGSDVEADYDNLFWLFGFWTDDGVNIAALAHHEFYPRSITSNNDIYGKNWINAIHHLTSNNGGKTFLPQKYVSYMNTGESNSDRLVLIPKPYDNNQLEHIAFLYGFFHPTNIVKEWDSNRQKYYYYAICQNSNYLGYNLLVGVGYQSVVEAGFVMFRTDDPYKSDGWEGYTENGWQEINKNTWQGKFKDINGQYLKVWHGQYHNPFMEYPRGGQGLTGSLVQHSITKEWILFGYSNMGYNTICYSISDSLHTPAWKAITPVDITKSCYAVI